MNIDSIVSSIDNITEDGKKFLEKTYAVASTALVGLTSVGLAVTLITAPVPTLVGLYILWIINGEIEEKLHNIDSKYSSSKKKRFIIQYLKKFGNIPREAVVETKFLKTVINTEEGSVVGEFIDGGYKGQRLSSFSILELEKILSNDTLDKDTQDILSEYIQNRKYLNE